MSTKMEVVELRSLDPDGSSMTINIHHTQEEIIVISSKSSLYDVFQELTLLSLAPMKLTHESIIGTLLSHEEDTSHFCGSLIPLPVLSNMVNRVLEADSIHIFLQVASCLCNLVVQEKPKDVGSMISSGRNALRKSVEVSVRSPCLS